MLTRDRDKLIAFVRDPDTRIAVRVGLWACTDNPVYLWETIGICIDHNKPLPVAVTDYLAAVAHRMSEARQSSDLREVLPKILGFPKARPGPRSLLNPDTGDPDNLKLAVLFATNLELEQDVPEALANATAECPAHFGTHDERTLKKWIAEAVGLESMPCTADEWRTGLRSSMAELCSDIASLMILVKQ